MRIPWIGRGAAFWPRLLCAAALVCAGGGVSAADEPAAAAFKRLDRDGNGIVTFEEFVAASDTQLAGMDRNRDGNIGRDEFMGYHEAQERRLVDRVFAALDKKKTGKLTAAQLEAGRLRAGDAERLKRCDLDKDGVITRVEHLECRRKIAERWMERIFAKYDKNGDGFIGREERVAALRDFFGRLDANGDGKVVRTEFAAARERWQERRSQAVSPQPGDSPSKRTTQPDTADDVE